MWKITERDTRHQPVSSACALWTSVCKAHERLYTPHTENSQDRRFLRLFHCVYKADFLPLPALLVLGEPQGSVEAGGGVCATLVTNGLGHFPYPSPG